MPWPVNRWQAVRLARREEGRDVFDNIAHPTVHATRVHVSVPSGARRRPADE